MNRSHQELRFQCGGLGCTLCYHSPSVYLPSDHILVLVLIKPVVMATVKDPALIFTLRNCLVKDFGASFCGCGRRLGEVLFLEREPLRSSVSEQRLGWGGAFSAPQIKGDFCSWPTPNTDACLQTSRPLGGKECFLKRQEDNQTLVSFLASHTGGN